MLLLTYEVQEVQLQHTWTSWEQQPHSWLPAGSTTSASRKGRSLPPSGPLLWNPVRDRRRTRSDCSPVPLLSVSVEVGGLFCWLLFCCLLFCCCTFFFFLLLCSIVSFYTSFCWKHQNKRVGIDPPTSWSLVQLSLSATRGQKRSGLLLWWCNYSSQGAFHQKNASTTGASSTDTWFRCQYFLFKAELLNTLINLLISHFFHLQGWLYSWAKLLECRLSDK